MAQPADIGLIGLAVMGQNLALNMADHGYRVAVFNRTVEKVDRFVGGPGAHANIVGTRSVGELAACLAKPRRIVLMVKAGKAVDQTIDALLPVLEHGDLIMDGGNSHYPDTTRRTRDLAKRGFRFLGTGISGGEEGARHGPSIMPGGDPEAWPLMKEILQAIAARAGGEPCCEWVGEEGAGHYVKMVHNGIEYGDMQLIAEAYHLMRTGIGLPVARIRDTFATWNAGVLDSYLIEITADILGRHDADGTPLVDKILDSAGQKGTGRWTSADALELGVPLTLISEAVFARFLSSLKDERASAADIMAAGTIDFPPDTFDADHHVGDLHDALYASKIVSYAQGFMLMRAAAVRYGWNLAFGDIAALWRAGCIIRSRFLSDIRTAFSRSPDLTNLLIAPFFTDAIAGALPGWRRTLAFAVQRGIPMPAMSAALAFYDGYRSARLPADLIQAQRDYFGAHTYERVDAPLGEHFHTDWQTPPS